MSGVYANDKSFVYHTRDMMSFSNDLISYIYRMTLRGFQYIGSNLRITIEELSITIFVNHVDSEEPIYIKYNNTNQGQERLEEGKKYSHYWLSTTLTA